MYACVQVDSELRVNEVAQMFGHFVMFSAAEKVFVLKRCCIS